MWYCIVIGLVREFALAHGRHNSSSSSSSASACFSVPTAVQMLAKRQRIKSLPENYGKHHDEEESMITMDSRFHPLLSVRQWVDVWLQHLETAKQLLSGHRMSVVFQRCNAILILKYSCMPTKHQTSSYSRLCF